MSHRDFVFSQIRDYESEIQEFLNRRRDIYGDLFRESIFNAFNKAIEISNVPRISLYCTAKKMTVDHLVLLLNLLAILGFVIYKLSKYLVKLSYHSYFEDIYHQIKE